MRAIVVGARGPAAELLRRLSQIWEVVVVDSDATALSALEGVRDFTPVVGDGSSQVVLRRAGIEGADAVIAATFDDEKNLEVIRIAKDAGLLRVVGVAHDADRLEDYRSLDVPAVSGDSLVARSVEVFVEPRRVISTSFAAGKAEAIEFVVAPDSPVAGKRLRQLHSEAWVIAAILRGDEFIIPKGSTRLEIDDRVTVVGAAANFTKLVQAFTAGESRFPLNFGRKAAVLLESVEDMTTTISEAINIVRQSRAEELVVVHPDPELGNVADDLAAAILRLPGLADGIEVSMRSAADPVDTLLRLPESESIGIIVTSAAPGTSWLARRRIARHVTRYSKSGVPILLSRQRHPYEGVVVPARRTISGEAAARAAIDIARNSGAALIGVTAVAPAFASSGDALEDAKQSAAWLREEAAVLGIHVRRRVRRGNPVRIMEEVSETASLLVLSIGQRGIGALRPGIAGHLVGRVRSSILLVPRNKVP